MTLLARTSLESNEIRYSNPGASSELVLPVTLMQEAPEDMCFDNVRKNSELPNKWLNSYPENNKPAIVCGFGPTLKEFLPEIAELARKGGTIFACNYAAQYLVNNGIIPDYQIVFEPLCGVEVIGNARDHLFASVCNPALFEAEKEAILWHPLIPGLDDQIKSGRSYCGIGGGVMVGNSAICIAYTMGHRDLQCFGLDCSHKNGESHAVKPESYDNEIYCDIEVNGKIFNTTFSLKQAAFVFKELRNQLIQAGCSVKVHGDSLLPSLFKD